MNDLQAPLMARLVPVALVSLGLLLASPVTAAAMTEAERCNWKADKVEARYARCLTRSATRLWPPRACPGTPCPWDTPAP